MSNCDSSDARNSRARRDGWTAERQLRFIDALARTRSVTRAAAFVGMSRESAYRLRGRREGALFGAAWDRAMQGHNLVNLAGSATALQRRRSDPLHRQNRDRGFNGPDGSFTTP